MRRVSRPRSFTCDDFKNMRTSSHVPPNDLCYLFPRHHFCFLGTESVKQQCGVFYACAVFAYPVLL